MKQSNKTFMVLFYAPWCGHCQNFKPQYEAAAKHLNGIVPLVAVDCTNQKTQELCARYNVTGYPSVKLFNSKSSKRPIDYMGGRTKNDVVRYVKMEMRTSFVPAKTVEEFTNQIAKINEGNSKIIALLINNSTVPMQVYKICNLNDNFTCVVKTHLDKSDIKPISSALHVQHNKLSNDKNKCQIINDTSLQNVKKLL